MLCQHNKDVQKNQSEAFYSRRHQKKKWENKNDQVQGQRIYQKTQTTIFVSESWVNKASMLGLEKSTTTSFTSCQIIKFSHNPRTETKKPPWNLTCMHTQHKFQKTKRGKKCSRWRIKNPSKTNKNKNNNNKTTTQCHYCQNRVSCGSWRHSPWFKDPLEIGYRWQP